MVASFELYVARVTIPRTEWAKEALSLLDNGPFCVVSHLGLVDSDDYDVVKKCLQQRYVPAASFAEPYAEGWRTAGRLCWRAAHAG